MKFLNLLFLMIGCLGLNLAQARYFVIPVTSAEMNPAKRTHVVITGRGNDLNTSLQFAATAKIRKIRQIFPLDQIVLITTEENEQNERLLQRLGYKTVQLKEELLDTARLMDEVTKFKAIASLHVFSHSGVVAGLFLDRYPNGVDVRWAPQDPQANRLANHFTPDAFATLNGCNAGHVQAPILSGLWKIPVAGALSSSHLEGLYKDGRYYWTDKENKSLMQSCVSGICYRLRPDNANYHGYWGTFKQGLPFYKFFCAANDETRCLSAMAVSMALNISVENAGLDMSLAQYANVVREWLCPSGRYPMTTQKTCMEILARIDLKKPQRTYSPFLGGSAQCDFKTCYEAPECMFPDRKLCPNEPPLVKPSTTFVDEYLAYLNAYKYLRQAKLN